MPNTIDWLNNCLKNIESMKEMLSDKEDIDIELRKELDMLENVINKIISSIKFDRVETAKEIHKEIINVKNILKNDKEKALEYLKRLVKVVKATYYDFTGEIALINKSFRRYFVGVIIFTIIAGLYYENLMLPALLILFVAVLVGYELKIRSKNIVLLTILSAILPVSTGLYIAFLSLQNIIMGTMSLIDNIVYSLFVIASLTVVYLVLCFVNNVIAHRDAFI